MSQASTVQRKACIRRNSSESSVQKFRAAQGLSEHQLRPVSQTQRRQSSSIVIDMSRLHDAYNDSKFLQSYNGRADRQGSDSYSLDSYAEILHTLTQGDGDSPKSPNQRSAKDNTGLQQDVRSDAQEGIFFETSPVPANHLDSAADWPDLEYGESEDSFMDGSCKSSHVNSHGRLFRQVMSDLVPDNVQKHGLRKETLQLPLSLEEANR